MPPPTGLIVDGRGTRSFLQANQGMVGGSVLGTIVLCVLVMLVVPLPTPLLDTAIAANLCVSVLVLLTAFFLPEPARLPSFPTIILVTTLFRLSINVSSTRLILFDGDAGEIIKTFGNFAAGGDIVVGAVVFLVLTIVQFVVIAKGSERVAEVAARFTLDAMQGRQLAIDADLSGGRIDPDAAKVRRTMLDRESKLYGAMDGAMKFVKGDAIAGIIISVINVVAGLIIGVLNEGMAVGEAARHYTVLSVGDGLVSQIPSLLISVAAGLVVTRVAAGDDGESNAASDMAQQLAQLPTALLGTAAVMLLVAATSGLTGFPPIQFSLLGAGLAALGVPLFLKQRAASKVGVAPNEGQGKDAVVRGIPLDLVTADRISVRVGPGLLSERLTQALPERITAAARSAARECGVPMPQPLVRVDDRFEAGYAIYLHTRLCAKVSLDADEVVALCSVADANGAGVEATSFTASWEHPVACRVKAIERARLEAAKIRVLDVSEAVSEHLRAVLLGNASEFLSLQDTFNLLEAIRRTHPDLVSQVQSRPSANSFSTTQVAEILRDLANELVTLRDLPLVLSGLSILSSLGTQQAHYSETLRSLIRPLITAAAESEPGKLLIVEIDPGLTERLARTGPATDRAALESFRTQWEEQGLGNGRMPRKVAIMVTNLSGDATGERRRVRQLLRQMLPLVPVITSEEIPSGTEHEVVASIFDLSE